MLSLHDDRIRHIETLVGQRVRRDISRLVDHAQGNLQRAAHSLATARRPHIAIVTGFFIRHGNPPSAETDGLNGTAHLAAGLTAAGWPVRIITDAPCAKAVWAVLDALPERVPLDIVDTDEHAVRALRRRLESLSTPLTHLIAVERVAPAADGKPHREHGWDMSRDTAPLHLLFDDEGWTRPWVSIGIGDGGNEIGMGALPPAIVAGDIPHGELIAATTACDHLLVAGVSNWGAYGLLAALACLRPDKRSDMLRHFTSSNERAFLSAAVHVGQAIDDSRIDRLATPQMSVDRIPLDEHALLVDRIRSLCLDEARAEDASPRIGT